MVIVIVSSSASAVATSAMPPGMWSAISWLLRLQPPAHLVLVEMVRDRDAHQSVLRGGFVGVAVLVVEIAGADREIVERALAPAAG